MRKRCRWMTICLIVLAAVLLSALVACDGSYKNKDKLRLKPWQDYIEDVSRAIDLQYLGVSTQKPISVEIDFNVLDSTADARYEFSLLFNLDPNNRSDQQGSLQITKNSGEERRILIDIYNEGERLYLSKWQNEIGKYEQTIFENAPLLYTLQKLVGGFDENVDYSTPGVLFETLAGIFFKDGSVNNAEATEFVFKFDLKKGLQSASSRRIFEDLPQVLQKVFFSVANVENYDALLDKTPSLIGDVNINLKDKLIDTIYCDNLEYVVDVDSGVSRSFSVDMPLLRISNTKADMTSRMPNSTDYDNGRLSDVSALGKVVLESSSLGKSEMQYDYEFNAKIDLLQLFAEDGDLNCLKDDNFFHFRMIHKCNIECGAFCKDKYDVAKGAILDVAFSPKDFGTYDVYISVGARALLGADAVSKLTNLEFFAKQFLPEYVLIVISSDSFSKKSQISAQIGDGNEIIDMIEKLLLALQYEDASFSFSIDEILTALGLDGSLSNIVDGIFKSEAYSIDSVRIKQEKLSWHVKTYDVKRSAIHLYGNDVSGTKTYSTGLINNPMIKYIFDGKKVLIDGEERLVADIYNDAYVEKVFSSKDVPICEDEIQSIVGSYVTATTENIYGESGTQNLYVTGHSEIDENKTGWQEIELYCLPIGDRAMEKLLWENIRTQKWSKWLCHTLTTYVFIDKLDGVTFIKPEKTQYSQGARFSSNSRELLDIETELAYGGGMTKRRYVEASNADDLFMYDTSGSRYIKAREDTLLNYYLFGGYCGVKVSVLPAKEEKLVLHADKLNLDFTPEKAYSTELCVAYIRWLFEDGSDREARLPLMCLKINGYAFDEQNDYFYYNKVYASTGIVFRKEGDYVLTYEYDGQSLQIPLTLAIKVEDNKSEYGIELVGDVKEHYFVGYEYNFNAEIFNVYHGDLGGSGEVKFEIRKGQISSLGDLTYPNALDGQDCFDIVRITIDSRDVELPYKVELPPTIYGSISLRVRVKFTQSGYYQLKFSLGSKTCVCEIFVESADF